MGAEHVQHSVHRVDRAERVDGEQAQHRVVRRAAGLLEGVLDRLIGHEFAEAVERGDHLGDVRAVRLVGAGRRRLAPDGLDQRPIFRGHGLRRRRPPAPCRPTGSGRASAGSSIRGRRFWRRCARENEQVEAAERRLIEIVDVTEVGLDQIDADLRVGIEQRQVPDLAGEAEAHLDGAVRPAAGQEDAAAVQRQVGVEARRRLVQTHRAFHQKFHDGMDGELRHVAVHQQVDPVVFAERQLTVVAGQADQLVGAGDLALTGRQPFPAGLVELALHEDARFGPWRRP